MATTGPGETPWPWLTLSEWEGTRESFLLWAQVVGKVRLALEPMVNHWWQVPLYVSSRGLTTSLMHAGTAGIEIEFNFLGHFLDLHTTDGRSVQVPFGPMTVATFFREVMAGLGQLGVEVAVMARPVEVAVAVPFAEDHQPRPYDPDALRRFWLALVQAHRVMTVFRARYTGKVSPVHFFWGAIDLAVTRFSGRPAPKHPGGVPNCADWVQEVAYSHEVSSCGFWPGGSTEGSFYAYAYPQPAGFDGWPVEAPGYYDHNLGEFLLPYQAGCTATTPDGMLLAFFQRTYEAAAELAAWDRDALEAPARGLPGRHRYAEPPTQDQEAPT